MREQDEGRLPRGTERSAARPTLVPTDVVPAPGRDTAARAGLAVRAATPEDLSTVVALRLALLREHASNPIYNRLRADARQRAERVFAAQLVAENEVVFLAERGGRAVGILRCIESAGSPLLHPARYGYISSVYVVPAARRAGVLRDLFAEAAAWCERRGLTELRLHNAADNAQANAAWAALGFEVVEHLRMRTLPLAE